MKNAMAGGEAYGHARPVTARAVITRRSVRVHAGRLLASRSLARVWNVLFDQRGTKN
jgi:hypothetical protein